MNIGLRISERMAGWICFDTLPPHDTHIETHTSYPFEVVIHAFASRFASFPINLVFKGQSYFPGLPLASHLQETKTHPFISGTMKINPLQGVSYTFNLEIKGLGRIEIDGAKSYNFATLSWKEFRNSLITLPLIVKHEGQVIGKAKISYLEPLWHFPLGLALTHSEWAHQPNLKLALKISSYATLFSPNAYEYATPQEMTEKIDMQISGTQIWTLMIIRFSLFLIELLIFIRFFKTIKTLSLKQKEFLSHLLSQNSFLHCLSLPLMAPLGAAIYSSPRYLSKKNQYLPNPPKQLEEERWMALHQTPTKELSEIEVDVVVIGSGAGGGAAAYEFARQGHAVAILEEGHYFKRVDMTGDRISMMNKLYRERGHTFAISNTLMWLPTGKCVGGTTTINCGTSIRTPKSVIERWHHQLGLKDVELEPYFDEVENMLQVKPVPKHLHGGIDLVLNKGLSGKSYSYDSLPRGESGCDGQSFCAFGCPTGAKRSTDISYIPEALKNNAFLFTHYKAQNIIMEGTKAIGVKAELENFGNEFTLTIKAKKIVVATGSFGTPHLLKELTQIKKLTQFGKNLTVHPAISFGALFPISLRQKMYVPQSLGVFNLPHDRYVLEGYTFSADTLPGAFASYGKPMSDLMEHIDHFASFAAILKDSTYGKVKFFKDKCWPVYWIDEKTCSTLKEITYLMGEIFLDAGASAFLLPIRGLQPITQKKDLLQLKNKKISPYHFTFSAHHPLGTCRMGSSPTNSVTNSLGLVWGTENLHIVDGSVIPGPLGVNPQVTIMANSLRIAREIGKKL